MNFTQGMQRLAIFAGVLGAVAGGFYVHKDLRNVPSERYQHRVFEKLAASEIVKRERALLLSASASGATFGWPLTTQLSDPWAVVSIEPLPANPPPEALPKDFNGWDKPKVSTEPLPANPQSQVRVPRGFTLIPEVKGLPPGAIVEPLTKPAGKVRGVPPGLIAEPLNGSTKDSSIDYEAIAKKYGGVPIPSQNTVTFNLKDLRPVEQKSAPPIATNGIETIFWKPDFSVDFFAMQDGGIVDSGPSPSAWSYLLWVAFPALGFFVLWGLIRGIGWVGTGFFPVPNS